MQGGWWLHLVYHQYNPTEAETMQVREITQGDCIPKWSEPWKKNDQNPSPKYHIWGALRGKGARNGEKSIQNSEKKDRRALC